MSKLIRVFKYRRVSTLHQVQDGDSLQDQDDVLNKYIDEHQDMICVGSFFDGGVSGRKTERDGFQELMEHVKNNECDLIIFTRLDRWFRNLRHSLNTNAILEQHNVQWIAVEQPYYETRTAAGRAFFANSMAFAQFLAENNAETIIEHNKAKVARGEVLTGSVGIGFYIDENKHLKKNDENHIIVEMYDYYEQCNNLLKTSKWLESTYGYFRTIQTIKRILMDEKNIGKYRDNRNWCEPTVSIEQYNRVCEMLKKNVKQNSNRVYIFSGLIICGYCQKRMSGKINIVNYKYKYKAYRCSSNAVYKHCCNNKIIYESTLEKYLLKNIMPLLKKYIVDYNLHEAPQVDNSKKIKNLQDKMSKLKTLYLNDLITLDEFKKDQFEYTEQINELAAQGTTDKYKDLTHLKEFLSLDLENIYKDLTELEKRALWRSIIKKIIFYNKDNIEIVFL